MAATAFAHDPIFTDTPAQPETPSLPVPPVRPELRVIQGAGSVPVPAAQLDPMVEVYRRRRFLAALAATVVVLALCQVFGLSITSFGVVAPTATSETPVVHVVRPGDTYGSIAAELGLANTQASATELRAANGGAMLAIGDRLVVDVGSLAEGSSATESASGSLAQVPGK